LDLSGVIERFMNHKKFDRMEGSEGVRNFCRLVNAMGYRDYQHFGQFEDACYGDLIEFLEDNPGAIEALLTWIGECNIQDWKVALESDLPEEPEEEEDDEEDPAASSYLDPEREK